MYEESFWLGGTKLGNGEYFYWFGVDKPLNIYTNLRYQHERYHSKNCLQMVNSGIWIDADCDGLNYFVCEKFQ